MQTCTCRVVALAACLAVALMLSNLATAQSYSATYLVSNVSGKAAHTDPLLQNGWGLAYAPTGAFWVSDEASGYSTLYDGSGNPQTLKVVVPPSAGTGLGTPTGIVYNGSPEFKIDTWTSLFLFATLDGTISGWSAFVPSTALIGVRQAGAVYTGLAITSHASGNFLYAADTANNRVDVYDGNFNLVKSISDPVIPAGFSVFGVQVIAGHVLVSYASTTGAAGGAIDAFSENGTFQKRLVVSKTLNQPWGMALAPANWGPLSGTLLVSNNTVAGTINGFSVTTGTLVGTVKDSTGTPIAINGLWGIEFGGGATLNGNKNQLFFAAGPQDTLGSFGAINFR
jgi:uncharacterized protein (TIGR03118 family)